MGYSGIGVMLQELSGNKDDIEAYKYGLNKTIEDIIFDDDSLILMFTENIGMKFYDAGQSCCESRYMTKDEDDLSYYIGSKFLEANIKSAESIEEELGQEHEIEFLEIKTSKGEFTIANHNEHNGYYGGFAIRIEKIIKGE